MSDIPRPVVAVCAVIVRGGQVLLGKRKGCYAEGQWGFPGGHLEGGETWSEGVSRELLEETGMTAKSIGFITVLNIVNREEKKHFVDIYMSVLVGDQEPEVTEEFCHEWKWFSVYDLPTNLMQGTMIALYDFCQGMYR
jgi:8-oxo-dGTP diphosphatase